MERTGRCHACYAIPPHPGIRAPFSPPVQFPGRWTLVESSKLPRQSDWVEQSDARPSTGVSSPGSPVSPCTGLGVHMAWFPFSTQWSLRAPMLVKLRWGGWNVATSCMAFVCHALACQHLHATRLWRGSACGTFHRTPMSSRHNS